MCGIFCCLERLSGAKVNVSDEKQNYFNTCTSNNARRGPDTSSPLLCDLKVNEKWGGKFRGYVLWTQGSKMIDQPHTGRTGNILLWNGDIFSGPLADTEVSDTEKLYEALETTDDVIETVKSIQGPFSFIYLQKSTNLLYFGRDFIGRHSLLMKIGRDYEFLMISSVASKNLDNFIEVPALGIFVVSLNEEVLNFSLHPWRERVEAVDRFKKHLAMDIDVKNAILPAESNDQSILVPRTEDMPLIKIIKGTSCVEEAMTRLLEDPLISTRVNKILELLKESVRLRIQKKPNYCKDCIKLKGAEVLKCSHSKVGLLFSGGLDSTILAAIAHEFIPEDESIDLINVAFEKVKRETNVKNIITKNDGGIEKEDVFRVPDRKTGRQALEELSKIYPKRRWNFVETNVTEKELDECRRNFICHVIFPLRTILDESLGCALWFAARGVGLLSNTEGTYESPCRILLLGMGADELFGGYIRHRNTLKRNGWAMLSQELNEELLRISERNLGRDDRVVSDHGKQSRLPYLDENFIEYVTNLKAWERCCPVPEIPPGFGDKLLLRLCAFKIGLRQTSRFPKRAFQFGSRIAKSHENAKDLSKWL